MDYKIKKEELEKKFNKIKEELIAIEQQSVKGKEELLRIQGEFRLLEELEKSEIKKEVVETP